MSNKKSLFKKVDCYRIYVPDLEKGLEFYTENLGLKIIWKTETAIGLGMDEDVTELVIQKERKGQEVDLKVDSVEESIEKIKQSGGNIIHGPFDIKIGKCAVVRDPWENEYVILDSSKGTFITDKNGNITGQNNKENKLLENKPDYIKDLYEKLQKRIIEISENIEKNITDTHIDFRIKNKIFVSVQIQYSKIKIWINLKQEQLSDPYHLTRDVSNQDHYGKGDYEIHTKSDTNLEEIIRLIKQAYDYHQEAISE